MEKTNLALASGGHRGGSLLASIRQTFVAVRCPSAPHFPLIPPMTRAIVASSSSSGTADLQIDLQAVGVHVLGAFELRELVQQAIRHAPDVIVLFEPSPDESLFTALAALAATVPLP